MNRSYGKRGASGRRLGEWHGRAKHSDELVRAILEDYRQGVRGRGYRALGKRYGLGESTVRDIVTGRTRWSAGL